MFDDAILCCLTAGQVRVLALAWHALQVARDWPIRI